MPYEYRKQQKKQLDYCGNFRYCGSINIITI
nr:MAG TPA: UL49 family protein [Microviridae sp.]